MRFTGFINEGCLVDHEYARNRGLLKWLDRWDEATSFAEKNAIVFNSHQWLAIDAPDPQNTHFNSMVKSGKELCREHGVEHDELWIWVDYSSIPQACDASKFCAIRSIMVYASCCKFFVAVTPQAVHVTRGQPCDELTYRRRGWCRLEQWAFMINGGVDNMYVFDGEEQLVSVEDKSGWFVDMINVLDGEFSVDSDKHMLVDVILGLYGFALICDRDSMQQEEGVVTKSTWPRSTASSRSTSSVNLAARYRDVAFPVKYFKSLNDRLEREVEKVFKKEGDILWSKEELAKLLEASKAFTAIHKPPGKTHSQGSVEFV
jgi:hypothetical protein